MHSSDNVSVLIALHGKVRQENSIAGFHAILLAPLRGIPLLSTRQFKAKTDLTGIVMPLIS